MSAPVVLHVGDEQPPWVATLIVNGSSTTDFSTWTFSVKVVSSADGSVLVNKTTGITGGTGAVTVSFTGAELASLAPTFAVRAVNYQMFLKATSGSFGDITQEETLQIEWAP